MSSQDIPYVAAGGAGSGDVVGPASSTDSNIVLFNGATGKIIKDSGKNLSEYTAVADWGQNGFENETDSDYTFDNATRTFSLQPTTTSYDYFIAGVKYTATGDTVIIDNTEGLHVIYYDGAILKALANPTPGQTADAILNYTLVSYLYWDVSEAKQIYLGEERHGKILSPSSHSYHHFNDGLIYLTGLGLNTFSVDGTGNVAVDAQFGVDAGSVADEDIFIYINAVGATTGLPIHYITGSSDWNQIVKAGYSVDTFDGTSSTRLFFNEYTGGAWQKTQVASGNYVCMHVFATTEKTKPMIMIVGTAEYNTIATAKSGATSEINNLLISQKIAPEFRAIASIIYQTKDTYSNAVKARVVSVDGANYIDHRSQTVSKLSLTTSDHAALTNLPWTSSGHTGTAGKVAAFDALGDATEIDSVSAWLDWDATRTADGTISSTTHLPLGTAVRHRSTAGTWRPAVITGLATNAHTIMGYPCTTSDNDEFQYTLDPVIEREHLVASGNFNPADSDILFSSYVPALKAGYFPPFPNGYLLGIKTICADADSTVDPDVNMVKFGATNKIFTADVNVDETLDNSGVTVETTNSYYKYDDGDAFDITVDKNGTGDAYELNVLAYFMKGFDLV
jgi:hypothetical protein